MNETAEVDARKLHVEYKQVQRCGFNPDNDVIWFWWLSLHPLNRREIHKLTKSGVIDQMFDSDKRKRSSLPIDETKQCERCTQNRVLGERFCPACRKLVIREMERAGYLILLPRTERRNSRMAVA